MNGRTRTILFVIIAGLVAFGVYSNTLQHEFVWDGPTIIRDQVTAFRSAEEIFFPSAGILGVVGLHYYRPLVMLSYMADDALWSGSPAGFHLTNVLLHALCTVLVFFLTRVILTRFEDRDTGALVAALLFAVHPIHTESVAWMVGRSDVMGAIFSFASLLLYARHRTQSRWFWLALSALAFLAAGLAKETALTMLLLLPVMDWTLFRDHERAGMRRRLGRYAPFVVAAVAYLLARNQGLGGGADPLLRASDPWRLTLDLVNSYGYYVRQLVAPFDLVAFVPVVPSGAVSTLLSAVAVSFLLAGLGVAFLRRMRIVLFALTLFLITLIPSVLVAIMDLSETALAERYLYIPSLSLSILLGLAYVRLPAGLKRIGGSLGSRRLVLPVLLAVLLLFSIQTMQRNRVWQTAILFWEEVARRVPDHGLPHLNLGLAYEEAGRSDDAEREYLQAIRTPDDDEGECIAYNNLGNIYLQRGAHDRAEQCFDEAISVRPGHPNPYYSMGLSLFARWLDAQQSGQTPDRTLIEGAIEYLNHATELGPRNARAHTLLGDIMFRLGRHAESRRHLEAALRIEKKGKTARMAAALLQRLPPP